MATNTPTLGLVKPAQKEYYNVDIFNDNADKVDTYAENSNTRLTNIETLNTQQNTRLTNVESVNNTQTTAINDIKAKAQMSKITSDTGSYALNWGTADDFGTWIENCPLGLYTGYFGESVPGAPSTASGRFLINKQQTGGDYGYGYVMNINYLGEYWYMTFAGATLGSWEKVANTSDLPDVAALESRLQVQINDIKSKAQMKKVTSDNGNYALVLNSGDDLIAKVTALGAGFYTIKLNQGVINAPDSTTYWHGTVLFSSNDMEFELKRMSDYPQKKIIGKLRTGQTSIKWDYAALQVDVDIKADISKAQMSKITADNGGVSYIAATGTMEDFLKSLPVGLHTVRIASGVENCPGSNNNLRGYIYKESPNTTEYPYGVINFELTDLGNNTFVGQAYGTAALDSAFWEARRVSKNHIRGGTTVPATSLGNDGDIYVQYI